MSRVVAVGHCTVDHLGVVGHWPALDRKEELEVFSMQGGGPAATAAATLAVLGVDVAFVGKLSDDHLGRFARESLQSLGVDCGALCVEPGRVSPMSFIAVDRPTGKRTVFWTKGDLSPLGAGEVSPEVLDGAALLLVDGHQAEAQLELALEARRRGLDVLLDAGSRRPGMEDLLKVSTHVVASERFAAEIAGAAPRALDAILGLGPRCAVVTLGEDGAVGREGPDSAVVAAYDVDVVDTTGAGDVYHGAYAFAMLQGWGLRRRMEFAGAAAALKCRQIGGRAALPSVDEVTALAG